MVPRALKQSLEHLIGLGSSGWATLTSILTLEKLVTPRAAFAQPTDALLIRPNEEIHDTPLPAYAVACSIANLRPLVFYIYSSKSTNHFPLAQRRPRRVFQPAQKMPRPEI
ncbi:hypothetical protein THAR02_08361 [Trichoderma harzianum]|uniref:Uncharacterized protein n=1 Tax=Trichoderma harzianum TaxID=5544 RepID=A0A0F9XG44_TRIHA|nr:hypothetical protein THAR02_08361 [Trichoderma harzianum]